MEQCQSMAYTEILEILTLFSEEQVRKIPESTLKMFLENRDENYNYVINYDKKFYEQEMLPETMTILQSLFVDYWATDKQRDILKQKYKNEFLKEEEEKRKRYNIDDIFTNRTIKETNKNQKSDEIKIVNIKWYNKIFNLIKNIFKIKK